MKNQALPLPCVELYITAKYNVSTINKNEMKTHKKRCHYEERSDEATSSYFAILPISYTINSLASSFIL